MLEELVFRVRMGLLLLGRTCLKRLLIVRIRNDYVDFISANREHHFPWEQILTHPSGQKPQVLLLTPWSIVICSVVQGVVCRTGHSALMILQEVYMS